MYCTRYFAFMLYLTVHAYFYTRFTMSCTYNSNNNEIGVIGFGGYLVWYVEDLRYRGWSMRRLHILEEALSFLKHGSFEVISMHVLVSLLSVP